MKVTFYKVFAECSRIVTKNYSTSFSLAINFLNEKLRGFIYEIYGFVGHADDIVEVSMDTTGHHCCPNSEATLWGQSGI